MMKNMIRAIVLVALTLVFCFVGALKVSAQQRPLFVESSSDRGNSSANWAESGEWDIMGDVNNPHFPRTAPTGDLATTAPYHPRYKSCDTPHHPVRCGQLVGAKQRTLARAAFGVMQTSLPASQTDRAGFATVVLPAGSRVDLDQNGNPLYYRGTADGQYLDCHNRLVAIISPVEREQEAESFTPAPKEPTLPPVITKEIPGPERVIYQGREVRVPVPACGPGTRYDERQKLCVAKRHIGRDLLMAGAGIGGGYVLGRVTTHCRTRVPVLPPVQQPPVVQPPLEKPPIKVEPQPPSRGALFLPNRM